MSKKNWIILLIVVTAGLLIICCILAIIFGSFGDKTRTEKPAVEAPKPDKEPGVRTEEPAVEAPEPDTEPALKTEKPPVEAPEPDLGPRGERINGDKWIGCVTKEEYKRLIGYAVDKDEKAFGEALLFGLANGTCTIFKDGEIVYLEDTAFFSGLIQVRRKGEHVKYWTAIEAVSR